MGIIFALIASFLQGIGYTFLKRSFMELPPSISFMFEAILGVLIWIPYSLFVGVEFDNIFIVFIFASLSALLSEAFVFFVLSKGEVSITGTVFSTYPVFTMLFSRVMNEEVLGFVSLLFVVVTILGVVVLSLPKRLNIKDLKEKMYILWPLAGALAVGVSDTMSKGVLERTDSSTFLFCLAFAQIPVAVGYLGFEKQIKEIPAIVRNLTEFKTPIAAAIALASSMIFFWLAFENTLASVASPITATQMLFVLILSRIFLNEKVKDIELGGILLTVAGIIGVGIFA